MVYNSELGPDLCSKQGFLQDQWAQSCRKAFVRSSQETLLPLPAPLPQAKTKLGDTTLPTVAISGLGNRRLPYRRENEVGFLETVSSTGGREKCHPS